MSLPLKEINRLFDRLIATYGNEWVNRWQGLDGNAIKSLWAHELSIYAERLSAIEWALENLPPRSPNVIEFRNICRQAPYPEIQKLPEPKADPERVRAEISKLATVLAATAPLAQKFDHKAWARRIMGRYEEGEKLRPVSLRFANEALGIRREVGD